MCAHVYVCVYVCARTKVFSITFFRMSLCSQLQQARNISVVNVSVVNVSVIYVANVNVAVGNTYCRGTHSTA